MNREDLEAALVRQCGGYIFPARSARLTLCSSCRSPIDSVYSCCYQCYQHQSRHPGLVNLEHGFMFYAFENEQSHWMMRRYKGQSGNQTERQNALTTLHHYLFLAFDQHFRCLENRGLEPFDAWTIVPSVREDKTYSSREHPLYDLIRHTLDRCQIGLPHLELRSCPTRASAGRVVSADRFEVISSLKNLGHVLICEDTWVSGGHISSAVLSVQNMCQARVSTLALARYIKPEFLSSAELNELKNNGELDSYHPLEHCLWGANGGCIR